MAQSFLYRWQCGKTRRKSYEFRDHTPDFYAKFGSTLTYFKGLRSICQDRQAVMLPSFHFSQIQYSEQMSAS